MMLHLAWAAGRALISAQVSLIGPIGTALGILTAHGQLHKQNNTNLKTQNIDDEMTQIVCTDAVVNPWTVTGRESAQN